jgi:O-methyltransferase
MPRMASAPRDMRLRIPGFRRYAVAIERLQGRLAEVERDCAHARQFEYYWANAEKKIDVLGLLPFGRVAAEVLRDGRTYLNVDRLYTLWQAVSSMPAAADAVAEVGTYKGGSAKLIAEALRAVERTIPFYVCDTFTGHAVVDPTIDGRHRVGKGFRSDRDRVAKYLKKYAPLEIVQGDIRETATTLAAHQAFGMVHLDVDVYPVTQFCLEFFAPRMAPGATIVVDDYGYTTCKGVKKAVDEFVAARGGEFWAMHLLTAQAVLVRLA